MLLKENIKMFGYKPKANTLNQLLLSILVFNALLIVSSCNPSENNSLAPVEDTVTTPPPVIPADKISRPEFDNDMLGANYEAALNRGFTILSIGGEYNVGRKDFSLSSNHTISSSLCAYKWTAKNERLPNYDCVGSPAVINIVREDKTRTFWATNKNDELIEVTYNIYERLLPQAFGEFQFSSRNWYLDELLVHSEELQRHYVGNEHSLARSNIRDWARKHLITFQHERPTSFSDVATDNIDPELVFSDSATEFIIYPTRTEIEPYFTENFSLYSPDGQGISAGNNQINNLRVIIDGGYYLEVAFNMAGLDYPLNYEIKLNASHGATEGNATLLQYDSIEGTFTWKLTKLHGKPALVFEYGYEDLLEDGLVTYELPLAIIEAKNGVLVQKYADISYERFSKYGRALNSTAAEELINALHPNILNYIETANSQ